MLTSHRLRPACILLLLAIASLAFAQQENMETIADVHHLAAYFVAAMLIMVFVMIFSNRIYYYQEQAVNSRTREMNTQLGLVLDSNKTMVWTYDTMRKIYTVLLEHGQKKTQLTSLEFADYFLNNDFNNLRNLIAAIEEEEKKEDTLVLKAKKDLENPEERIVKIHVSVLMRDKKGKPKTLIGTGKDITEDTRLQIKAKESALRYHTVFNSSLADMIFYDADGVLTDLNDKACETFCIRDREALLRRRVHISDIPSYRHIDIHSLSESIQISSITDISRVKHEGERIPECEMGGKFYYEVNVCPIHNRQGRLLGVVAAGTDITEMVESHHRQQLDSQLLQRTTKDIESYINDINYTLRTSGVRLIKYDPDVHELEIFSDLNITQYHLSQMRCGTLVHEKDRRRVRGLFLRMDHRRPGAFTARVRTILHDDQGRNIYLTFSLIPITDRNGYISHYSGIFRNETELTYTEMRLREETQKAQETEELKNTFLQNMSYEIRTPLNAVIGFAELFNSPHDEEDEPVFAGEIKRNTGELLALINDILFMSRLDANMVEFKYQTCDFAALFDGFCYMGLSMLNPGVTMSIENPYKRLMVNIDEGNLGEVIRKLCTDAAHFTREGSIRAKYEYRHGELNISIEDTGRGISKTMLPHVFERFVRDEYNEHCGTGLDLPIVKELVEQMGGSIEIQSEKGKGSIVYVIIPCEMTEMEKKTETV